MSVRIALAGNPNSGKTTLFNRLVGAREKIGNWPGTTVERKKGHFDLVGRSVTLVDLPGTYSLSAYSLDELIARDYLVTERPELVAVVADATNLERSLLLVTQLLEMGERVVLALNMTDLADKQGVQINAEVLSCLLRIPVVRTIAPDGVGVEEFKKELAAALDKKVVPLHVDYGELESRLIRLEDLFNDRQVDLGFSNRALAVKFAAGDKRILDKVNQIGLLGESEQILAGAADPVGAGLESYVVEHKYAFVKGVLKESVQKHLTFQERMTISDQIDRVVTDRFWGLPIFLGFTYLMFSFVFKAGAPVVWILEQGFELLKAMTQQLLLSWACPQWVTSFVSDGVISGVGSVLVFLPYIVLLYLGISFLQDTGYLARAAFIMDRFMHALGLHGRSFIPMLLGFGCTIPGVLATRTLGSEKDRILTIMVLPLMSCAARLPVYTLLAAALFPWDQGLVVFSLYIFGIVLAIVVANVFKKIFFREAVSHLVMELPPYRLPKFKMVVMHTWTQAMMFVKKAGTVIFCFVVITWLLASLPWGVEYASRESLIGKMGQVAAPIFSWAGFGFWQAAVSLFFGIMAKEIVVGILGTLYGVEGSGLTTVLQQQFTPLSGYAFLVMTALYTPCIATIAVIRKETNWKWAGLAVVYPFILGWTISVLVYQVGRLLLGA